MILQERDFKLLGQLSKFGILSSNQIAKYFFNSTAQTTVLRRLRLLEHDSLIINCGHLPSGEKTFCLSAKGAKTINVNEPFRYANQNTIFHDVYLSEVRFVFEKMNFAIDWTSEKEMKKNFSRFRENVIPDGIFTANVFGKPKVVAFELELTPKSHQRYKNLFKDYSHMPAIGVIWYVVKNNSIIKPILKQWQEHKKQKHLETSQVILFSYFEDLIKHQEHSNVMTEILSKYSLNQVFDPKQLSQGLSKQNSKSLSTTEDLVSKPNQQFTSAPDFNLIVPSTLDPSTSTLCTVKGSRLTGTDKNTGAEVIKGKEKDKDEIDWWG